MKKLLKIGCRVLSVVVALLCVPLMAATVSTWTNMENGSAAAPLDYSAAANWDNATPPSGLGAQANFTSAVSGLRYVAVPEDWFVGTAVGYGGKGGCTYLLGGARAKLQMQEGAYDGCQGVLAYSGYNETCVLLFADEISVPGGLDFCCTSVAGDIRIGGNFFRSTGGNNYLRLDLYANAPGGTRTNPISAVDGAWWEYVISDGQLSITAPKSAAAQTGTWNLAEGSAVATRAGAAHELAVGTAVTGEGIPEGTFLKRVYGNDAILLSQAATATLAAAELSFAAQTVHVYQRVPQWRRQGSTEITFNLTPHGADDTFRFEADVFTDGVSKGTDLDSKSSYPATLVVHDGAGYRHPLRVRRMNVEFAEAADPERQGWPNATVMLDYAWLVPVFTVTNGLTATIGTLTNVLGTLVKEGAGTLRAGLVSARTSTGALRVNAGRMELLATPDGASAYVKTLALASGTTLALPPEGLTVQTLTAAEGAAVEGPGTLTVLDSASTLPAVTLRKGAVLGVKGGAAAPVLAAPEAKVAGHPAFWVDAARTDTMTLDGAGTALSRWNDCRAGETMFCTTIVNTAVYVPGAKPYVKLPMRQESVISGQVPLVWNVPLKNIRAVFLVQDPSDGGGALLGRSDRLGDADGVGQGGYFYRKFYAGSNETLFEQALVHAQYAGTHARTGSYFLNGEAVEGTARGYWGGTIHVVEGHFKGDVPADAFGTSYMSMPGAGGEATLCNGRMRICEYIVYTNELTRAERLQTAQYLSRKWRDAGIGYETIEAAYDAGAMSGEEIGLAVAEGESASVKSVDATGGTFTKSGAGTLLVKGMKGGSLHVAGGTAIVRSYAGTRADLPSEALWTHFDASDASTLTLQTQNGTNFVTKWADVRGEQGNGVTLRLSNRGGTDYPWLHAAAHNGLPTYDLGPLERADGAWASPKPHRSPEFVAQDGERYAAGNRNGSAAPALKSVFMFFDGANGGNSILGARGDGHYSYGFSAYDPNDKGWQDLPKTLLTCSASQRYSHMARILNHLDFVDVCLDGVRIADPSQEPFPKDGRVFSYAGEITLQTQSLAISGYDNWVNGLAYGEILLYTTRLSAEDRARVNAYLLKKWKNVDTDGFCKAELADVTVDAGATLQVTGSGGLTATSLAGGGTISGDVALAEGAVLKTSVNASGALEGVTVTGAIDLSKGGTVVVEGSLAGLVPGCYPLVTAAGIAKETAGKWTCATTSQKYFFHVRVQDGALCLVVTKKGLVLIVR